MPQKAQEPFVIKDSNAKIEIRPIDKDGNIIINVSVYLLSASEFLEIDATETRALITYLEAQLDSIP